MPTQHQGFRVVYNDVCKSSSNRPGIGRERNAMASTVIDRSCYNLRPQYVASNTVSEDRQLTDEEDGMESEQNHLLYDDGRCLRRHCTAIAASSRSTSQLLPNALRSPCRYITVRLSAWPSGTGRRTHSPRPAYEVRESNRPSCFLIRIRLAFQIQNWFRILSSQGIFKLAVIFSCHPCLSCEIDTRQPR